MDFSRKSKVLDGVDSIIDSLRAQKIKGRGAPGQANVQVVEADIPLGGKSPVDVDAIEKQLRGGLKDADVPSLDAPDAGALGPQARNDIDMAKQGVYSKQRGMPAPAPVPPPAPAPQKPTASLGGELVADASADRAAKIEKVRELMRNLGLDTSGLDGVTSEEDAEKEVLRRALESEKAGA
jgi:hypothetical protein